MVAVRKDRHAAGGPPQGVQPRCSSVAAADTGRPPGAIERE